MRTALRLLLLEQRQSDPVQALIDALTAAGILAKLDGLWINIGEQSLVNLISPGTYDLTASGGPVLGASGFSGDGVDAYLATTGYTPDGSKNYKQNDASVGVWVTAHPTVGVSNFVLGAAANDITRIGPKVSNAAGARARLNNSTNMDVVVPRGIGLTALRRNSSSDFQLFKDGGLAGSLVAASSGLPNELTLLRTGSNYSPDTIATEWMGGSLTDAEMATIYRLVARALRDLGAISPAIFAGSQGSATWFNDPRALTIGTEVVAGVVAEEGSVLINRFSPGEAPIPNMVSYRFQVDDHANPALLRRSTDGKLLAFFSAHNNDRYWMAISAAPDSAASFGSPIDLGSELGHSNYAYANVFQLASGRIILFYRATNSVSGDWAWHYSYTDDASGETGWMTGVQISSDDRPYHKFRQNGDDRIDIIVNDGHPNVTPANGTYHFYLLDTDGTLSFHKTDGTSMGDPPFDNADWTQIYDAHVAGRSWIWDVVIDDDGHPVVCFAVFPENVSFADHRYYQARWNGSAWSYHEICAAGGEVYPESNSSEEFYSGGVITDPDDINTVYCSRQVDGSGEVDPVNGVHQLFKYVTDDDGATWNGTQLTSDANPSFRPYIAEGSRLLTYVGGGTYTSFNSYATYLLSMRI
jgi:hypothetical protein